MRIAGLDILRLAAVLLVLCRHLPPYDSVASRGGWVGVDLFFVLSGWLVSGLLFREYRATGAVKPGIFLLRRGFKIYPAFWFFLLFSLLWFPRLHPDKPALAMNWIAELGFFQNYAPGIWPHTWSLAVEEHFYILLAGVVWLFCRFNAIRFVPQFFLLVAAVCMIFRYQNTATATTFDFYRQCALTHLRIDSLLFGVLLSYWHHFAPADHWMRRIKGPIPVLIGAALFIPVFVFPLESTWWLPVFGPPLFYVGAGLLVVTLGQWRTDNKLALGAAYLGATSYSTYLWHLVALDLALVTEKRLHLGLTTPMYFVGSFVLGIFLARVIENPFLKLRDRWLARPAPAPVRPRPLAEVP